VSYEAGEQATGFEPAPQGLEGPHATVTTRLLEEPDTRLELVYAEYETTMIS
jgi:hypothetical protein